jgi:hypothetical protein
MAAFLDRFGARLPEYLTNLEALLCILGGEGPTARLPPKRHSQ